eukprot:jgi/Chlat1/5801/Chrsp4S06276
MYHDEEDEFGPTSHQVDDGEAGSPSQSDNSAAARDFASLLEAELSGDEDNNRDEDGDQVDELEVTTFKQTRLREDDDIIIEEHHLHAERRLKRRTTEEVTAVVNIAIDPSQSKVCPPHPGFMRGVCIRCGVDRSTEVDPETDDGGAAANWGVNLHYVHPGLELSEHEAERLRKLEVTTVLKSKRLLLILDLDHTLLNSARHIDLTQADTSKLDSMLDAEKRGVIQQPGLLHHLKHLAMWTKLRPYVREFLQKAGERFLMYVYTMGERAYAAEMAKLLDPDGRFFGPRVISASDSTSRTQKDLDIVLGADTAVLILDDTVHVWPKHRANLVVLERYHYFPGSRRQFGLPGSSMFESGLDEDPHKGMLASILDVLCNVHQEFFSLSEQDTELDLLKHDVREVLQRARRRVLQGCCIVFSRIFPRTTRAAVTHPLWQSAIDFGAKCVEEASEEVTHVVAVDQGTEKVKWARKHGKHVVKPAWLEYCTLFWKHAPEQDFALLEDAAQVQSKPAQ